MTNTTNIWGTKTATVSIESVLLTYSEADDTGRALIVATGVAAQTVEAKYEGASVEADSGWDF
jgi:hypothetical protein